MTVETKHVEIGGQGEAAFETAKPVAKTVIRLDGDSDGIVPMQEGALGGLEVNVDLMNMHQQNVDTAIEYRARLLNALIGILKD
jgi:hypothetical protein